MSNESFEFSKDWTEPFRQRSHRRRIRTVPAVLVLLASIVVLLFFALAFYALSQPAPPPSNNGPAHENIETTRKLQSALARERSEVRKYNTSHNTNEKAASTEEQEAAVE